MSDFRITNPKQQDLDTTMKANHDTQTLKVACIKGSHMARKQDFSDVIVFQNYKNVRNSRQKSNIVWQVRKKA